MIFSAVSLHTVKQYYMHEIITRSDLRNYLLFIPDRDEIACNIKKLSIVIPAYNEENTIQSILDRISQIH